MQCGDWATHGRRTLQLTTTSRRAPRRLARDINQRFAWQQEWSARVAPTCAGSPSKFSTSLTSSAFVASVGLSLNRSLSLSLSPSLSLPGVPAPPLVFILRFLPDGGCVNRQVSGSTGHNMHRKKDRGQPEPGRVLRDLPPEGGRPHGLGFLLQKPTLSAMDSSGHRGEKRQEGTWSREGLHVGACVSPVFHAHFDTPAPFFTRSAPVCSSSYKYDDFLYEIRSHDPYDVWIIAGPSTSPSPLPRNLTQNHCLAVVLPAPRQRRLPLHQSLQAKTCWLKACGAPQPKPTRRGYRTSRRRSKRPPTAPTLSISCPPCSASGQGIWDCWNTHWWRKR